MIVNIEAFQRCRGCRFPTRMVPRVPVYGPVGLTGLAVRAQRLDIWMCWKRSDIHQPIEPPKNGGFSWGNTENDDIDIYIYILIDDDQYW